MIGFLEGLLVTLKTTLRRPVTAEYPIPDKRLPVAQRYMGFPALTWDYEVGEPYCTGCMVCIRDCPTQCMSATMKDNPLHEEGRSRRRKIVEEFEINLGRCILCGICVDVCNFDAIEMSHEHELSKYERNANRVDLPRLIELGTQYQAEIGWRPTQPEKNSGVPVKKETGRQGTSDEPSAAEGGGASRRARPVGRAGTGGSSSEVQASGDGSQDQSAEGGGR